MAKGASVLVVPQNLTLEVNGKVIFYQGLEWKELEISNDLALLCLLEGIKLMYFKTDTKKEFTDRIASIRGVK